MSEKGLYALQKAIPNIVHYPDATMREVKEKIAYRYDVEYDSILLGNGATELFHILMQSLSNARTAWVFPPTFSEYERVASVYKYPVSLGSKELLKRGELLVDEKDILFLAHPNNPTGDLLDIEVVEAALRQVPKGLVVIDESFIDFTKALSYRDWIERHSNLVIIHSMTKFYAMPGLRLAAMYAHPEYISWVSPYAPTWNINHMAVAYFLGAIEDTLYAENTLSLLQKEKEYVREAFKNLTCFRYEEGEANFYRMVGMSPCVVKECMEYLEKKHILVRSCHTFQNMIEPTLRLAVKNHASNVSIVTAIKEYENDKHLCSKARRNRI